MEEWRLQSLPPEEELAHVLLFSKRFFDAFEFETDRARQWQFLTLVVEKAPEGQLSLDAFSYDEINKIAKTKRPLKGTYYWEHRLVNGFRNSAGSFLTPVIPDPKTTVRRRGTGQEKPRLFSLTPAFDAAARDYLRVFLSEMLPTKLPKTRIDSVVEERGHRLFKDLTLFLKRTYWPAWGKLVLDICSGSISDQNEMATRSADWAIVLLTYKKHLEEPARPYRERALRSNVLHAMQGILDDEFDKALNFLVERNILATVKIAGTIRYSFNQRNEGLEASICEYINALSQHRMALMSIFGKEFGVTTRTD
jgi:hypothetical protein